MFTVNFTKGIDNIGEELLDLGVLFGIIEKTSAVSYDFKIIDGEKIVGREKAIAYAEEHKVKLEELVRDYYLSGKNTTSTLKRDDIVENPFEYIEEIENSDLIQE